MNWRWRAYCPLNLFQHLYFFFLEFGPKFPLLKYIVHRPASGVARFAIFVSVICMSWLTWMWGSLNLILSIKQSSCNTMAPCKTLWNSIRMECIKLFRVLHRDRWVLGIFSNKTKSRFIITYLILRLGEFHLETHKQWLKDHPHKQPKPLEDRTFVSHMYSNGAMCESTGKPREVEVCMRNSKQALENTDKVPYKALFVQI